MKWGLLWEEVEAIVEAEEAACARVRGKGEDGLCVELKIWQPLGRKEWKCKDKARIGL